MSINGALPNAKWPDFVLTETDDGKVVGETFKKIDNQRWIGEYNYDQQKHIKLVALQNKFTKDYLAWDDHMNVVMKSSKYWWKFVFVEGNVGFQVPEETSANTRSSYTLELEADQSVTLKIQEGNSSMRSCGTSIGKRMIPWNGSHGNYRIELNIIIYTVKDLIPTYMAICARESRFTLALRDTVVILLYQRQCGLHAYP